MQVHFERPSQRSGSWKHAWFFFLFWVYSLRSVENNQYNSFISELMEILKACLFTHKTCVPKTLHWRSVISISVLFPECVASREIPEMNRFYTKWCFIWLPLLLSQTEGSKIRKERQFIFILNHVKTAANYRSKPDEIKYELNTFEKNIKTQQPTWCWRGNLPQNKSEYISHVSS